MIDHNLRDFFSTLPPINYRSLFLRLLATIVFLIVLVLILRSLGINLYAAVTDARATLESFGPWGPAVFIILHLLLVPLLLPAAPLTFAAGILWGTWRGTLYALIGATLGSVVAFYLVRLIARLPAEYLLYHYFPHATAFREILERRGFKAIIFLRLVPIIPFSLLSMLAGLTPLRSRDHFWGTLLGSAPSTFAYVYLGESILLLRETGIAIGLIIFTLLIFLPFLLNYFFRIHIFQDDKEK